MNKIILILLIFFLSCEKGIEIQPEVTYTDGIGLYFPFPEEPRINHYLRCTEVKKLGVVCYYFETGSDSTEISINHIREFWPDVK